MQDIVAELRWRGLIHQSTDDQRLGAWLTGGSRTLYAGFDPTADSLHVGSLLPLMVLRRFQRAGHQPIALVGGATGMIGDPSGKSAERNLLDLDRLQANVAGMQRQIARFLDFDAPANPAQLVNNVDWMGGFTFLSFLRDIGKHFPVNAMLAKDSVKSRIERDDAGISYTEFSYMLLQAYDFVHLHREYGCELQVGGSDQWGNITAGIDLARRMHGAHLYGMTCPLLLKSDGSKMGKSERGAIWLSREKTSPYAFYQYWVNVEDKDVRMCLRFLTELPHEEIESLEASIETEPHLRKAQKRLAESLTQFVHGDEGLAAARRATEVFFGAEFAELSAEQLLEIFADVPSKEVGRERLAAGFSLIDALTESGLVKSRGEARRTIEQSGAYVNNRGVTDIQYGLSSLDLVNDSVIVLRRGRKNYALLRLV
ncbi:MAG: tyrosine--tRNA ligase [Pirellulales bacterium]